MASVMAALLQVPTPGLGPEELETVVPGLVRAGWFVVGLLGVVLVGWLLVEPAISRRIRRRNRGNRTLQEAISRYVRLVAVIVGIAVGAVLAGYGQVLSDSTLIIAAATLALGVAAQSVIGSLVSGLVLVFDPEFNVGDDIEWDDGEGVVTSITLRVTRLRTPDGELVTVPNTLLTSQAITRPFGRGRARVVEHVGLAPGADIDEALALLEAAAAGVEGVLAEPPPAAYVDAFGGDAVDVQVFYWIAEPSERHRHRVRSAFARAAMADLEAADVPLSRATVIELADRASVEP